MMSDIKRYDPVICGDNRTVEDGRYVLYADQEDQLATMREDVLQYQNVLVDMAIELCAAMGCDVEKYETDQAEYECYRDCFRDATKQLATMRGLIKDIIADHKNDNDCYENPCQWCHEAYEVLESDK